MLNKYYQDELAYLREMGQEFARAYPEGAHFVGEASKDPDVERLLEGFAFLTARLRQKLESELPELTQSLLELFWPHYLRPIPSLTVVQFEPLPQAAKEFRTIPRGVAIDSIPVDGTPCHFKTCYEVPMAPVVLEAVTLKRQTPPLLTLRLRFPEGITLKKTPLPRLRLHLTGDAAVSRALYACLCRYLRRITAQAAGAPTATLLGRASVVPVGFSSADALLPFPFNSFPGFRLLQEYFAFPSKFMFLDVTGLEELSTLGDVQAFDLSFELSRLPEAMPPVALANVALNCTPAINLFSHDADPVRIDHTRSEYRLRPQGRQPEHFEVFSVDHVKGLVRGTGKPMEYLPFFGFQRTPAENIRYYRHYIAPHTTDDRSEVLIAPVLNTAPGELPEAEVLSVEMTCTNRQLPSRLNVGDVNVATASSPANTKFKNILRPTASIPPPNSGDLHWRLLSHLTLTHQSLIDPDRFRALLELYHFRARVDRQAEHGLRQLLEGIKSLRSAPVTRLYEGAPLRGLSVQMDVDEEKVGGEGEAHLFGSVLNEFLSQYVSLNAFIRLTVKGIKFGEIHTWPTRVGERIIL